MARRAIQILGVCFVIAWLFGVPSCKESLVLPPQNQPPTVALTAELDDADPLRLTVDFTFSAIDDEGSVVSVILDFDDGTTPESIPPNKTTPTSHLYASARGYTAKVTATDDEGAPASASATIMVGFTTGACCLANGVCQDGTTQAMCDNLTGLFTAGAACNTSPCTACPDLDTDGWAVCDNTCQPGQGDMCGDCDDTDVGTFPGAASNNSSTACMRDADGDDYGDVNAPSGGDAGTDCDDTPMTGAGTFPGAAPNDSSTACMRDGDGDDYGDVNAPSGGNAGTDCDDGNNAINPGTNWHQDLDDDTFGNPSVTLTQCAQPTSFVLDGTDCDDSDAAINPLAPDICDGGVDNDCNAVTPDICSPCVDADSDLWAESCNNCDHDPTKCNDCNDSDPNNWVSCATCLDADGDTFFDMCDAYMTISGPDCNTGVATCTNNCAPDVDNDATDDCADTCLDADGDGYGAAGGAGNTCTGADCDDTSPTAAATFPGAAQVEDPIACMRDVDDDGYGDEFAVLPVVAGGDCDDTPTGMDINPGRTESHLSIPGSCANESSPGVPIDDDCDNSPNSCDTACTSFLQVLNTLESVPATHTLFPTPTAAQATCAGCHTNSAFPRMGPVTDLPALITVYGNLEFANIHAPNINTHCCGGGTTPPMCNPCVLSSIQDWQDEGRQCTECAPPQGAVCPTP